MATLTSASTDQQVRDEYDNTASYHETADVALARRHVTACRIWLNRHPRGANHQDAATQFNPDAIQQSLDDAQSFVATNAAGNGGVIHAGFREFRR